MALQLIEGFDHYASGSLAQKGWASVLNVLMQAGRFGGQAITKANNHTWANPGDDLQYHLLPSTYTTLTVGFAFGFSSSPASTTNIFRLYNAAASSVIASVSLTPTRLLSVTNATTTIATGTTNLAINTWYYIELKIVVNGATGSCELHVDGVTEIASTVGNFGTTNIGAVGPCDSQGAWGAGAASWDDLYVCDNSGSVNNTFLGDVRVETVYPNADGAHLDFVPSSGPTHYTRVNENPPDDDTTYVASNTVGARDSYGFADLSSVGGTVFGVQENVRARKDGTAVRQIAPVARPGVTDHDGAAGTLTSNYLFFSQIWETNPDTSSPWTVADVDAAEFGIKLVA